MGNFELSLYGKYGDLWIISVIIQRSPIGKFELSYICVCGDLWIIDEIMVVVLLWMSQQQGKKL